jgi:hypothetical protein
MPDLTQPPQPPIGVPFRLADYTPGLQLHSHATLRGLGNGLAVIERNSPLHPDGDLVARPARFRPELFRTPPPRP